MDTLRCYRCGERVRERDSIRRQMKVGKTQGSIASNGGGIGWFNQAQYSLVDVCLDCDDELNKSEHEWLNAYMYVLAWGLGIFFGTVLIGSLIWFAFSAFKPR